MKISQNAHVSQKHKDEFPDGLLQFYGDSQYSGLNYLSELGYMTEDEAQYATQILIRHYCRHDYPFDGSSHQREYARDIWKYLLRGVPETTLEYRMSSAIKQLQEQPTRTLMKLKEAFKERQRE